MPKLTTKKTTFPTMIFRRYRAFLIGLINDFEKQIETQVYPILERYKVRLDEDELSNDPTQEIETALVLYLLLQKAKISREVLSQARALQATSIAQFNALAEDALKNGQGINGGIIRNREAMIQAWTSENARLVEKMLDDEKQALLGTIARGFLAGVALNELKKEIKKRFKQGLNKAKLIAVNEIGNLSGSLERLNALGTGFNLYVWSTALDERVRGTHRPLEGMICSWEDSTIYKTSIRGEWLSRGAIGATTKHPRMAMRYRCNAETVTGANPENVSERNEIRKNGRSQWLIDLGII